MIRHISLQIDNVRFTSASPEQVQAGILGFVRCTLNNSLVLDGLLLRRTRHNKRTLSFPYRRDATGRQHFYLRPLDDRSRRDIEKQVFAALAIEKELT